jgi:uncharacterized protein
MTTNVVAATVTDVTMLLLPPSEGKASGGTQKRTPDTFAKTLGAQRSEVLGAIEELLASHHTQRISKILGVRGDLLDRAVNAYVAMFAGTRELLPAWQRYSGVVWSALGPENLATEQLGQIVIPSALYGITTALDRIADYRLTFKVGLGDIGNLAHFWRPALTAAIAARAAGGVVVDLLPAEHAAAVDFAALESSATVVRVEFLKSGGRGAAGHGAKTVKGQFARHLIEHGLGRSSKFKAPGWHLIDNGATIQIVEE